MKKIYSLALAAVAILSAASCQKELVNETVVDNGGDAFKVTAISATDSKTVLDGVNTYWTPGDLIALYDANGAEVTFSTDITETAAKAVFTAESEFVPHADGLLAVYPKRTDRGATSYANGVVTGLHIGGTQQAVAGSFDPKFAVALGVALTEESNDLLFVNVHSLVKFTVGGETAPSKVTLKNNGARMIAGMYNVDIATGEATVTAGAGEITLNGPFEVGKTYYIALTHGICGNGISLYYDGVEMKNTGETITLEPNKIYNLGTLPAAAEPEEPKEPAKLWTKYPVNDLAGFDPANKVKLAAYGDKILLSNTTNVFVLDPISGALENTIAMPEDVLAQNILVDDAGNLLIAADIEGAGSTTLYYVADPTNITPEPVFTYNGDYYASNSGNFRVKGNIKDDAVITGVASDGAGGACLAWEIIDGVCGDYKWTTPPYTNWNIASLCFAPLGSSMADGFLYIGYGGDYNLKYTDTFVAGAASNWVTSYVTGSSWMENYNCISTAEWNGNKYAAIVAGCHFDYDDPEALLLNVNNPAAAELVYTYQGAYDVRDENWASAYWTGVGAMSDVLLMPTEDALLMAYIDSNAGTMSCVAIY